jgi:ribonuclease HI
MNSDFLAKRSGQTLANARLYREFYSAHDYLNFQIFKVPGHSRTATQTTVQRLFSCVDRKVRLSLKAFPPIL